MNVFGFQWDSGNWPKCGRHGLTRAEIEAVFERGVAVAPDIRHSQVEERHIAIGRNSNGRPVFIGFVLRVEGERRLIRPITARYMHAKEIRRYEAQGSADEKR
jgi:uncharacterized DUF497 family protein